MKAKLISLAIATTAPMVFIAMAPAPLKAATFTVTSTADSGAGSLRAALKNSRSGDTITFSLPVPSTITLTSGELIASKNLTILGPGAGDLAVSGNHASRVFRIASRTSVSIAGLTIANGFAAGRSSADKAGGGIYNDHATLLVSNCVLTANVATDPYGFGGGAICNDAGGTTGNASLTVVNCVLSGNSALDPTAFGSTSGGAIYNYATSGTVSGSSGTARLSVLNCIVENNFSSRNGGGLYTSGNTATATIVNTTFRGNSSKYQGGAVENELGSVTLQNCTLDGNRVPSRGGGIHSYVGSLYITGCTFSANVATNEGGGVYGYHAALTVANSTFSGNSASYLGGGIYNYSGTLGVTGSTFVGNWAMQLGGLFSVGPLTIGSTILQNAQGDIGVSGGTVTSLGYNLSSDSGGGVLTQPTDQVNSDPLLGPLQDNGGPCFTHAPLPGSPAIDRGYNFSGSATDQRGFFRTIDLLDLPNPPGGDGTDIGAVEVQ